jgi:hypothetical protein
MKPRIKNTILHNGKRMVCRIYDIGPGVVDRYTVCFKGYRDSRNWMSYPYLACDAMPFHPQGFGQHGEARNMIFGRHIGKRIRFEDCPADVQKFILQNL